MAVYSDPDSPRPASRETLSVGYLFHFSLPLALTFLMMSGAAPIVSNGITWMHGEAGEAIHLSAFLLTFATALLIYSPMFVARNVAIRTITDRRSMQRFAVFFLLCAGASSALLVAVSQVNPLGHFVYGTLLDSTRHVERLAREGLLVFAPVPILVGLRGLGQGVHISNGEGWYVGVGTGLRLLVMGLFVFGYAIDHGLSGPVLGGYTYLTGIGVETVFVLATLRGKPQWTTIAEGPVLTVRQFGAYAVPLMAGSVLNQCVAPVLIAMIHRGRRPLENAATYNLMRDTAWLMFSVLNAIQPAVVAHATSRARLGTIARFGGYMAAGVTGVVLVVALTPMREVIFARWLEVDNEAILELAFLTLLWMIPVPVANMLALFVSALHTRSGRTGWVTLGNLVGLALLWAAATFGDLSAFDGVVVAVVGNGLFHLVSAGVQSLGLLNGGVAAAIAPVTLAEYLNRPEEALPDAMETPEPMPERVRA